jgi:UDP-2,4-diacetamido-2,4,6-trideoxy-beta-L-altropyranose hydrolase
LNCENGTGVISYSIAREARGQGVGSEIIRLIEEKAKKTRPRLARLAGDVKPDNLASQRIFEKNGYRQETVQTPQMHYRYIKELVRQTVVGIRVDANSHIATGHMMRCLSIAAAIRKTGAACVFFVANRDAAVFAQESGHACVALDSHWDDLEPEADSLLDKLDRLGIAKLLVDTYYATPAYLHKLQSVVKVIYIDDLNACQWPAEMLINYNIYSGQFDYPRMYRDTGTRLLLGCEYAPLRDEFRELLPTCRDSVQKVLVTTGGTDPYNTTGQLLETIYERGLFGGVEFHVIAGRLNAHADSLRQLADKRSGFVVHPDVRNMAELMSSCDLAVTAGGSTLYELCACGLPAVTLSFADNQLYAVKTFAAQGLMPYAGDMREDETACVDTVLFHLAALMDSPACRKQTADSLRLRVDGKGAERISAAIAAL